MDINCDLGEGEPLTTTRRLLRWVTSANIACGAHAGTTRIMRACLRLCKEFGVRAGAHPGFEDRENFGRLERSISAQELRSLVGSQAEKLARLAEEQEIAISHLKLHGALYHVVERDPQLASCYAVLVKERFPGTRIIASPKGNVAQAAARYGLEVWGELFADRAYASNGDLIPRSQPKAVLLDLPEIRARMEMFRSTGQLPAANGKSISIAARTICVHSDSPNAVRIARLLTILFGTRLRPAP